MMKCTSFLIVSVSFLATIVTGKSVSLAPVLSDNIESTTIDGEYIVVFHDNTNQQTADMHHLMLSKSILLRNSSSADKVVKRHQIGSFFKGYSARLSDELLMQIRQMPEVKYIERNMKVEVYCTTQSYASWSLVRTTIQDRVSTSDYVYDTDCCGDGVDVYIIDTGIQKDHPNFEGRVKWGYDYINSPSYEIDDNGHGTHVAGTVMSSKYGLAKKATAIAVKVLNAYGYGSWSGVIAGIEYTAAQHQASGRKSIANLSLGGYRNQAINDAVEAAKDVGVHVVVAAGNSRRDSCYSSPASAEVIAVAASNVYDEMAYFSNYGECVQIIAPGVSITSEWPTDSTKTLSGTSMASPHVAGVLAKYLTSSSCSQEDMSPDAMEEFLVQKATRNVISSVPSYTPNLLVFQQCT